jgi:4a-hydroxytetrahydrobiopterin dehydratase
MTCLSEDEVRTRLGGLPGWVLTEEGIRKTYALRSFREAVVFTLSVADIAEALTHHPHIVIDRNQVTVTLPSDGAPGVSDVDIALAMHIEQAQE